MLIANITDRNSTIVALLGIITVEAVIILHQFLLCFAWGN